MASVALPVVSENEEDELRSRAPSTRRDGYFIFWCVGVLPLDDRKPIDFCQDLVKALPRARHTRFNASKMMLGKQASKDLGN